MLIFDRGDQAGWGRVTLVGKVQFNWFGKFTLGGVGKIGGLLVTLSVFD
jgi:hypothetical protein